MLMLSLGLCSILNSWNIRILIWRILLRNHDVLGKCRKYMEDVEALEDSQVPTRTVNALEKINYRLRMARG